MLFYIINLANCKFTLLVYYNIIGKKVTLAIAIMYIGSISNAGNIGKSGSIGNTIIYLAT